MPKPAGEFSHLVIWSSGHCFEIATISKLITDEQMTR
jgi:hypothetical protein